jgi:hypothetical protein
VLLPATRSPPLNKASKAGYYSHNTNNGYKHRQRGKPAKRAGEFGVY